MASYGQFCPVAKTSELFAERWTPLVLRELCCGPAQFNDLRRRLPLMSKTLLAQRLRDLEQHLSSRSRRNRRDPATSMR